MTRFVAIVRQPYHTWFMRTAMTVVLLAAAAFLPLRADAFDLEEALRAQHVQYEGQLDQLSTQSDGMSLSEAIESVRRKTGGRVVSAETKIQGGREVHHIKVLTKDGKVRTHKVNGRRV